jgi:hypothetical protein
MAAPASSGGEQIDDFLDRCIGTMIAFSPQPPPPDRSGHHQKSAIARVSGAHLSMANVKQDQQGSAGGDNI